MTTPKLLAEFQLDENKPIAIHIAGQTHFRIRLFLKDVPSGVNSVTYQLHHSYPNAIREVPVGVPNFSELISSYGDYNITVILRDTSSSTLSLISTPLSSALEENYKDTPSAEIRAAIEKIKQN
jgi:hypothetical protein